MPMWALYLDNPFKHNYYICNLNAIQAKGMAKLCKETEPESMARTTRVEQPTRTG